MMAKLHLPDLVYMAELLEAGSIVPVVDRCYPLGETREALRYLAGGHARGKVIVMVQSPSGVRQLPTEK